MTVEVRVGAALAREIADTFGEERPGGGRASEWDFWSGPLASARVAFRNFDELGFTHQPDIRTLHLVDPVFGALVFVAVRIEPNVIELAAYRSDPDYWSLIENDPND